MDLTITTADTVPETISNRSSEPNPFDGKFPTAPGKSLVVTLPSKTDDEKVAVNKVVQFAQAAGRAVKTDEYPEGTTTRKLLEPVDKTGKVVADFTKATHTRMTFWSVKPIKRPRKDKDETVSPDAPQTSEQPATTA